MEATAERVGDEYLLDGRKMYIGNSHVGDVHGVVTRTRSGSKGLPVERYLRDAFHIFAPAGTSGIQLLRLGETALGTTKGQWSQRFALIR